jgi:hypothetical protein
MMRMKYVMLGFAIAFSMIAVAYAQEKGCEHGGKTYEHGEQLWNKDGGNKCWICDNGSWIQGFRHIESYCKGKY